MYTNADAQKEFRKSMQAPNLNFFFYAFLEKFQSINDTSL